MRKLLLSMAFVAACVTASADITIGTTNYSADTLFHRQIGPGIVNTILRIPDYPLNVYLLEADMNNPYNRVETMQGQGTLGKTELLTTAAKRYSTASKRVLAGCNANFWCVSGQGVSSVYMLGVPYGAVVRNDTIYTNTNNANDTWDGGPTRTAASAIDHNKQLYFGHFTWAATVASSKLASTLKINKVNRRNKKSEMCLWNEAYGRTKAFQDNWVSDDSTGTTNMCDNYYLEFAEGSGWQVNKPMTFVIQKIVQDADLQTLGNYEACITASGTPKTKMRTLAVGDTITINQGWTTNEDGADKVSPWIENMVEGNAPVMHNGELTGRNNDETYNSQVYSRTGYGCSADGRKLYMIVIDKSTSKKYGQSAGCSTTVMCQILKSLYPDVSEVVNYDAGGSAEMLVNGAVINTTTESTPRSVSNGWLLESIAPTDNEIASIAFADASLKLPVYASYTPQIIAYNQYGDVVNEDLTGFTLSCDASLGSIKGTQMTVSGNVMTGNLTATYNGMTATLQVTTMAAQPAIAIKPTITVDNQSWPLEVSATVYGTTYQYDASGLEWTVEDPTIATVTEGKLQGLKNGVTTLTCKIGDFTDSDTVKVEIPTSAYVQQPWTDWTLKGSGASSLVLGENGVLTYKYSSTRAPYIKLLKDLAVYSLPDTIGISFNSTEPIEYIQVDIRNGKNTAANYQKFENGGAGYEANKDYTITLDLAAMGGTNKLSTYPLNIQEIRFVPNKTTATAGEQTLTLKSFYCHYNVKSGLKGDINQDGTVNVSDVTALMNIILNDRTDAIGDIDENGTVNVSDVTALMNIILKN